MRMISDKGLSLIKMEEGYEKALPNGDCAAYWDVYGKVWTIGWGCTEGVKRGDVWTRSQAETNLRSEVSKHVAFVDRDCPWPANQNEFDAMASFSYNGGEGMLHQLLSHYAHGGKMAVANAFGLFTHSHGVQVSDLVGRRARERKLFLTPCPGDANEAPIAPKPTKAESKAQTKVIVSQSRHLKMHDFVANFMEYCGLTYAALLSFLESARSFAESWEGLALLGAGLGFYGFVMLSKYLTVQAAKQGRYLPSGAIDTSQVPVGGTVVADPPSEPLDPTADAASPTAEVAA